MTLSDRQTSIKVSNFGIFIYSCFLSYLHGMAPVIKFRPWSHGHGVSSSFHASCVYKNKTSLPVPFNLTQNFISPMLSTVVTLVKY